MPSELWLEVANVKQTASGLEVQLKADLHPLQPQWWTLPTPPLDPKLLFDALDKKRPVHVRVVADGGALKVDEIAIQYVSAAR